MPTIPDLPGNLSPSDSTAASSAAFIHGARCWRATEPRQLTIRRTGNAAKFQLRRLTTCDFCRPTNGERVVMRRVVSWALVLFVFAAFSGVFPPVSEAAAEPQPKAMAQPQPRSKAKAAPQSRPQAAQQLAR